jgi:TatD DNase family protein
MIDSHAHLDMEAFDHDRDAVVARAKEAGVEKILSLALIDEGLSYGKSFAIVEQYPELVTAVGCTPHDAKDFDSDGESLLEDLATHDGVLAIGEIGLDYHHNLSPPETQRDVFGRQVRVARRLGLPLIIHHREAEEDLVSILDEEKASEVGGVLHSFTAGRELARAGLERGFYISFSGILTFRNAEALREVARDVPMDRILVETDCPYLAPVPYRGKRNEPTFVREIARVLAELKGVSIETFEQATDENFHRVFHI